MTRWNNFPWPRPFIWIQLWMAMLCFELNGAQWKINEWLSLKCYHQKSFGLLGHQPFMMGPLDEQSEPPKAKEHQNLCRIY